MERNQLAHIRLPAEIKEEAKLYAVIDNRSLSGFIVESIKQRIERMKKERSKEVGL